MTTINWLERESWSRPPGKPVRSLGVTLGGRAPRFERQGAELVLVVPISTDEARNGALVMVPAPGAPVRLRVPPGTKNGRRFRVPRVSAPAPDGFGDLTVVVDVA